VLELRGVRKRHGTGTGGQVTAADDVSFTDDMKLTAGRPVQDIIRQVGQLG